MKKSVIEYVTLAGFHFPFVRQGPTIDDFSCDFCQNVSKLQIFTRYQLFGVSNHSGSLAYGHYTAYVRDTEIGADPGVWHDYNDSYVRKLDDPASTVCSNNAYLLFYRRIAPEDEATLVTPSPSAELI